MQHQQQEIIFLRNDINELANDMMTQSNFNVKSFKRNRNIKTLKNLQRQRKTTLKMNTQPNLQLAQSDGKFSQMKTKSKTLAQTFKGALKKNDTFITPQVKEKHTKHNSQFFKQSENRYRYAKSTQKYQTSFQKTQQNFNKGRLQKGHIANWLNTIIVETSSEEYLDKNIQNGGLKKFNLDENSLLSNGLRHEDVSRLYKSLFVYSIGYNNFVRQIARGKKQLVNIIWKIFGIMLEYCSKGDYESAIGEMQRDKQNKLSQYSQQLVKRQQIIEKNGQLNESNNNQIYRQLKVLKQENNNLENQKDVLLQEFNATQQAFNQQVLLRLKFQSKINQIYGIHRELSNKHSKLFEDFKIKFNELNQITKKYFGVTAKCREYKGQIMVLSEQIQVLKKNNRHDQEHIKELIKQKIKTKDDLVTTSSQLNQKRSILAQKILKIHELENDNKNLEIMLEHRQKSGKQTHSEYQKTLEENNKLYITVSNQRKLMQENEREKRQYNTKTIKIISQNSYSKRKIEEMQRRIEEITKKFNDTMTSLTLLQTKQNSFDKLQKQFKEDLNENYINIEKLHKINKNMQQELQFLRKYHQSMEGILKEKQQKLQSLSEDLSNKQKHNQVLELSKAELQSKIDILEGQLLFEKAINSDVINKIQSQKNKLEESDYQKFNLIKIKQMQIQRLSTSLNNALLSYKNQKFERTTLKGSYIQSLRIVEKKSQQIKDLDVKMSFMKQKINIADNRYKNIEMNMLKLIADYALIQEKLDKNLENQRKIIVQKNSYVNPMIYQDVQNYLRREVDLHNQLKEQHFSYQLKTEDKILELSQKIKEDQAKYNLEKAKFTNQFETKINNKVIQIEFQKELCQELKQKLQKLEELADTYKKKISERKTSQRQQLYRFMLEQKKREVETMVNETDKMQDELIRQTRDSQQKHKQLEKDIRQASRIERQKVLQQLQNRLEKRFVEQQRQSKRSIKQQFDKKINLYKQNMNTYVKQLTIEEIIKIKDADIDNMIMKLSEKSNRFKQIQRLVEYQNFKKARNSRLSFQNKIQSEDSKRRKDISNKIKNSYSYYQKL